MTLPDRLRAEADLTHIHKGATVTAPTAKFIEIIRKRHEADGYGSVPHLRWPDDPDSACPCGITELCPPEAELLELFDNWYGDKAYRRHPEVVGWARKICSAMYADRAELLRYIDALGTQEVPA